MTTRNNFVILAACLAALLPLLGTFSLFAYGEEARKVTLFSAEADSSRPPRAIVLPDQPSDVQKTAASELASFLNQVTGAEFPTISETDADEQAVKFVIGPGELSKKLLASAGAEPEETIGQDGIILQTVGNSIVISGHPDRGMLYAVYTFLEDYVGIRWWTSSASFIPSLTKLEVPALAIRYSPPLIAREAFYWESLNGGVLSVRLKSNFHSVPDGYGGNLPIRPMVHTFHTFLPPKDYFDEHPDWYPLIDGQRQADRAQLCLTNPEMKREFIRKVFQFLDENPGTRILSVSQNDWDGWCQCPECQKLVEENGSLAGPVITFVNEVADAVKEKYPDIWVETLAYSPTRFAPTQVRPRDNVLIRLCSSEVSFLTPLADGGVNQPFVDCIEQWRSISKHLYIWDYILNFRNLLLPHPNLQVVGPNIRFYVQNGVIGCFEQGDWQCHAGDFACLRNWVISKLLWDPSLDQRELENEFLNGYYSPKVGPILREYLDVLTESALRSRVYLRCQMMTTTAWLDTPALLKATDLMNRAIDAAEEEEAADPVRYAKLVKRVKRESIPIRYVWLLDGKYHLPVLKKTRADSPLSGDMNAYYEQFKAILAENYVNVAREWEQAGFDKWLASLKPKDRPCTGSPPPQVKDLPAASWLDTREMDWDLSEVGKGCFLEESPQSGVGQIVRVAGDHDHRVIKQDTDPVMLLDSPSGSDPDREGHIRGRVILCARCESKSGTSGAALDIGLYDRRNRVDTVTRTLTVDELAGPDFKAIDLGEMEFGSYIQLWLAPKNRPEAVPNIYVDRIVFIRE